MIYKCICCGETRESDKPNSCPKCGYAMFESPYDRRNVLLGEIKRFVVSLPITKVEKDDFKYFRLTDANGKHPNKIYKNKDDERFPSFGKIIRYVCSAEKTEGFFERARKTLDEIKQHLSTPFCQKYQMENDGLCSRIAARDAVISEASKLANAEILLNDLALPKLILHYSETPQSDRLALAEEILAKLNALLAKTEKFVKVNNVYISTHKNLQDFTSTQWNNAKSDIENLNETKLYVETIIEKRYSVDIFSDGSDELNEMYRAFWTGVYAVLKARVLLPSYRFRTLPDDGDCEVDFDGFYSDYLSNRYSCYFAAINNEELFAYYSEDELFELYNKFVEIDKFNILVADKSKLLKIGESEKKLNTLIGLSSIKESIKKIKAYFVANKDAENLNLHMCFYGNPGTGKTEVARIIAGILYENKILPTNTVVEVDRSDLIGEYMGQTPQKTLDKIQEAMGGVLFIDEAYSLIPDDRKSDYGHEAVATLIKAMEDYRGKFCVILAGYKNKMQNLIASNPGFKSRIQFQLDFPNYSREELKSIAGKMLAQRKYTIDELTLEKVLDISDVRRKDPNFANAREIRNVLDQVIMCQNLRVLDADDKEIGMVDVNKYISDAKIALPTTGEGASRKILTADEELEQLVGLSAVKKMVKKVKAFARRNKDDESFNMHMCFYGNPGTGKTEVARILSRILCDAGVLSEAKLVETNANGLIGKYMGETAPKTEAKIQEAMGGVLFIDEAYSLIDKGSGKGGSSAYVDEAIAVLLKDMEDFRGKFCVILAGYKNEMQDMIDRNPGFKSRIQFTLDFLDYTRDELQEIATRFATKRKYIFVDDALSKFLDVVEYYRGMFNFANARTVRNVLDQVIMNQNLRIDESGAYDNTIILADVEEYISDENIDLSRAPQKRRIGFV